MKNKTIIITGASRGIGRAIALKCAKHGANIVVAAKSAEPHPKLPGTIYSVAEEIESLGGIALPFQLDVRKELAVKKMMAHVAEKFGGIDVIINNAGAISLSNVEKTTPARYDLMQSINHRAVYLTSHYALPYLKQSNCGHIINLSPPINLNPKWLKDYSPYTLSKYGMTLLTLGLAEELKACGIAVNSLWPKTMIATAAIEFAIGDNMLKHCRTPEIMADAAFALMNKVGLEVTGQCLIDEEFLRKQGQTNFEGYVHQSGHSLNLDLFID